MFSILQLKIILIKSRIRSFFKLIKYINSTFICKNTILKTQINSTKNTNIMVVICLERVLNYWFFIRKIKYDCYSIEDTTKVGVSMVGVGVKGQAAQIYVYVGPRAQSEDSRYLEDRKTLP